MRSVYEFRKNRPAPSPAIGRLHGPRRPRPFAGVRSADPRDDARAIRETPSQISWRRRIQSPAALKSCQVKGTAAARSHKGVTDDQPATRLLVAAVRARQCGGCRSWCLLLSESGRGRRDTAPDAGRATRRARGPRTTTAPKSMPPLGCRTRHRGAGRPRCRDRPPGDPPSRRSPHQPLTPIARSSSARASVARSSPPSSSGRGIRRAVTTGTYGSQGGHRRLQMASDRASTRPSPHLCLAGSPGLLETARTGSDGTGGSSGSARAACGQRYWTARVATPLSAREAPGTPRSRPNAQFPHNGFTWLVPTTDRPEGDEVFGTCQSLAGHWVRHCADSSTPPSFVAGITDSRTTSHDPPLSTRWTRSGPYDGHAVRVRVHVDGGRGRCDPRRG